MIKINKFKIEKETICGKTFFVVIWRKRGYCFDDLPSAMNAVNWHLSGFSKIQKTFIGYQL